MKQISIAVTLSIALLATGCSTSLKGDDSLTFVETNGDTMTICHFNQVKDSIKINLSHLVKDFKIVRFENADSALFNYRTLPTITDNYIGISQPESGPYLLFDHYGKLKCQVGAVGNGPGEYSQTIYDTSINEKASEIYLSSFAFTPKIVVYNTNGNFVREVVAKGNLSKPKIEVDNNRDITIIHIPFENDKEKFLAIQYDKNGMFKQELKPTSNFLMKDFNQDIFAYHNVPEFSFWLTSCDTLFHYDKQANKIHPKFKLDFGDISEVPLHIYNELPGYYLTLIPGKGVIAVDKERNTSNYIQLVNDFFGHIQAPMFSFNGGWFFQMFEPGNLITRIENRLAENDCSDEDRKQLEEMLASINEDDNNILFMGKLK